jgi:hypothetical protein
MSTVLYAFLAFAGAMREVLEARVCLLMLRVVRTGGKIGLGFVALQFPPIHLQNWIIEAS